MIDDEGNDEVDLYLVIKIDKEMTEKMGRFYWPIKSIPAINSKLIEYMDIQESDFVEQMKKDSFLFNAVQDVFGHGGAKMLPKQVFTCPLHENSRDVQNSAVPLLKR